MAMRWPFTSRSEVSKIAPQSAYELWARSYPPCPHNALMEIESTIQTATAKHNEFLKELGMPLLP